MRLIFSLVGLLLVVSIVGFLTKKQLPNVVVLPTTLNPVATSQTVTPVNIGDQKKQIQTQVKDQLEAAMETATAARLKLEAAESK